MKKSVILFLLVVISMAFVTINNHLQEDPQYITPSKQRAGNAAKGYTYLTTGDYLKSGIPYSLFLMGAPKDTSNLLNRQGINKNIPPDFTAVKAPNGELVVAPNCLQCHAQIFDGKLIVGLGNSLSDYSINRTPTTLFLEKYLKALTGDNVKKYEAAKNFITSLKVVAPQLVTSTRGVNLADGLAFLLVSHRDPATLKWSDKSLMGAPNEIMPTDVPAWWLLKKKNAMFYNGFGRGDFGRFLMASNLLTVTDTAEAREVDSHFNDVLTFINSIEAPKFPKAINEPMARAGKEIFSANCAACHGSYGVNAKYPNLLIPESIIQTDSSLFTANYSNPQMVDWFNNSWFSSGDHPAKLVPYRGYIAPPLDGIWVTAPYLHNGSVPDLEGVLNSKARPTYWKRNFNTANYNYDIPGYQFEVKAAGGGAETYNTTLKGFSKEGHYFGDDLSAIERRSVIEYLKTL